MIKPRYLTHKPAPPAAPKRILDQVIVPALIDTAGALETAVERWAVRVRQSPGPSLGIAIGAGLLLSRLLARPNRQA